MDFPFVVLRRKERKKERKIEGTCVLFLSWINYPLEPTDGRKVAPLRHSDADTTRDYASPGEHCGEDVDFRSKHFKV